jgi:mRNA-degrading endonuclease toxin of MazEF toxin-antitoxin module
VDLLLSQWKLFKAKFKEIWYVDTTFNDSVEHEQEGYRPCIIIRDFSESEMILTIPLSTNLAQNRFNHTVIIDKNDYNNLPEKSVALIHQIKSLHKSRLKRQIGKLSNRYYNEIIIHIKEIFGIR